VQSSLPCPRVPPPGRRLTPLGTMSIERLQPACRTSFFSAGLLTVSRPARRQTSRANVFQMGPEVLGLNPGTSDPRSARTQGSRPSPPNRSSPRGHPPQTSTTSGHGSSPSVRLQAFQSSRSCSVVRQKWSPLFPHGNSTAEMSIGNRRVVPLGGAAVQSSTSNSGSVDQTSRRRPSACAVPPPTGGYSYPRIRTLIPDGHLLLGSGGKRIV